MCIYIHIAWFFQVVTHLYSLMTMQTLYDDQIYSYEMDSFGSKI